MIEEKITVPNYKWEVVLAGEGNNEFIVRGVSEPNSFWRFMQYIILGFKWRKVVS